MLLAVLINGCELCDGLPPLNVLKGLTEREDGVIIAATLLLFPTTVMLYGGAQVFFAAKEAVEKRAMKRGREEALKEERKRISRVLERHGVPADSELARSLAGESE